MKLKYYIASIALASLLFTGCQKDEFFELMEREVIQEESRLASDDLLNDDETGIPPGEAIDPDRKKRLNTPGVVKEVSDGDEESDDDDTTTES